MNPGVSGRGADEAREQLFGKKKGETAKTAPKKVAEQPKPKIEYPGRSLSHVTSTTYGDLSRALIKNLRAGEEKKIKWEEIKVRENEFLVACISGLPGFEGPIVCVDVEEFERNKYAHNNNVEIQGSKGPGISIVYRACPLSWRYHSANAKDAFKKGMSYSMPPELANLPELLSFEEFDTKVSAKDKTKNN